MHLDWDPLSGTFDLVSKYYATDVEGLGPCHLIMMHYGIWAKGPVLHLTWSNLKLVYLTTKCVHK